MAQQAQLVAAERLDHLVMWALLTEDLDGLLAERCSALRTDEKKWLLFVSSAATRYGIGGAD